MYDAESYADLMARVERLERAAAFLIPVRPPEPSDLAQAVLGAIRGGCITVAQVRAEVQAGNGKVCAMVRNLIATGHVRRILQGHTSRLEIAPPPGEGDELSATAGYTIQGYAVRHGVSLERAFLDLLGAEEVPEEAVHVSIQ